MHYKNDTSSGQTRKPVKKSTVYSCYAEERKEAAWLSQLGQWKESKLAKGPLPSSCLTQTSRCSVQDLSQNVT